MRYRIPLLIVGCVGVFGVVSLRSGVRDRNVEMQKPDVPTEQTSTPVSTIANPGTTVTPTASQSLPREINLAVPFSSQAPLKDWGLPWQEACEETSVLLVDAFWRQATPSPDDMVASIQRLVAWQEEHFGFYAHTTAQQTADMMKSALGYDRVEVRTDITVDDIVSEVRSGRPVIVPLAGRLLENQFYTPPGPVYHMLVVKGVTRDGSLITNDVGTRHGRNLVYARAVFSRALHDVPTGGDHWPDGVDAAEYILTGKSAMIVVYPNL